MAKSAFRHSLQIPCKIQILQIFRYSLNKIDYASFLREYTRIWCIKLIAKSALIFRHSLQIPCKFNFHKFSDILLSKTDYSARNILKFGVKEIIKIFAKKSEIKFSDIPCKFFA